MSGDPNIVH
jgi:hypothetical protein